MKPLFGFILGGLTALASCQALAVDLVHIHELAKTQDAQLQIARSQLESRRQDLPQARSGKRPQINLSANASYIDKGSDNALILPGDTQKVLGYKLSLQQSLLNRQVDARSDAAAAAIAKAEWQYDPHDNVRYSAVTGLPEGESGEASKKGAPFTGRDSFVALKGGFGLVGFGRFNGVYKTHGGVKYDPWVTTSMQARFNGGMSGTALGNAGFIDGLVVYQTPSLGPATITAQYEDVEVGGFDGTGTFLYASAKMDFGKVSVIPALGQFSGDAENSDASYLAVGAMYNFSKMTKGWIGYRDTNADKDEKDETATTIGLRMDF